MAGRRAAIAILLAATLGAACDGDDDTGRATTTTVPATTVAADHPTDGVLTIGMLLPSTGPGAAELGVPMREAVEVAVGDINAAGGVLGGSVRLVDFDEAHGGGFASLIEQGADAIVGPASSLVALAELNDAVEAGVVVCSPTATALALDEFPHNGLFFRTAPSDSLQMAAIMREVRDTGAESVAVAYLDDPYGRGLADAFAERVSESTLLTIDERVPFSGDEEDLSEVAEAVADNRVVVVLADSDDGGRFLTALDAVIDRDQPPTVIANDSVRDAGQPVAQLSPELRSRIAVVAPKARDDEVDGFFAANAVDCVNVIALAAVRADSDRPGDFRSYVAEVSYGGRPCSGFAECVDRLGEVDQIDYNGVSGRVDMRGTSNELSTAEFDVFGFDDDGAETEPETLTVSLLEQ
jgi:branched-chain amino acid transport system substrate-binding protein